MHKADPQTYYSALDVRSTIFSAMYAPKQWADFANGDLLQLWSSYASPDILDTKRKRDLARRDDTGLVSHPVWRRQYNDAPSQALEAITCGDAPDLKDVTTSSVFDEILRVTRDVSGFCMPFPFLSLFSAHKLCLNSRSIDTTTFSLLSFMACKSCGTFLRSFQRRAIQPDSCHRQQSRSYYSLPQRQSRR